MGEVNYGISGGPVTGHNIVVGPSGSIVENAVPPAIEQQLNQLRLALAAFEGDADTRVSITTATDEVADELAAPQPNKPKLLERLASIRQAAGSATAVTTAATGLISLIAQLL